jgi:apolipoprotein N-acyltransferase
LARYDKMFLVPFGEFVPPFFGWVNRISKESGDFVRGDKVVVVPLDGHGVGAFICYEAVFPHLVPRFTRAGAEVLFNLSNDGYFGRSSARHQHLLIARMRAAENRRWLIRSTNNGITVSIDPAGRIRQTLAPDFRTAARLRFGYEKGLTFYSRYGDWFAWSSLAASLAAALWAWWPKHSR